MPAHARAPNRLFRQVVAAENQLRSDHFTVGSQEIENLCNNVALADLLAKCATILRALWAGACAIEAIEESKARGAPRPEEADLIRRVNMRTGLDTRAILRDVTHHFPPVPPKHAEADVSVDLVLRLVKVALSGCPIEALQSAAVAHGLEELGHRCRVAYEGLQAFVLRADPDTQGRVRLVGEIYQAGAFSVPDVALLLGLGPADAVALLESHGYARPLAHIRLGPERREQMLSALRRDRLEDPRPWRAPTEEETVRHVIASERLEGIDARAWL